MTFIVNVTNAINSDRSITLGTATPGSPATGMIRWNSSLTQFEVYNGTAWVAILGNASATSPAWGWGNNAFGQLGTNSTTSVSSPVSVVGGITGWIQISSSHHTSAIAANGTAWTWGRNNWGQLGDNSTTYRSSPVSVVGGLLWKQVSTTSQYFTAAIRSDGTAWCWGQNQFGQLGDNTFNNNKSSPVSVVGGFTNWTQISASLDRHTAAIRSNGTAWCWGRGEDGRLGNNSFLNYSSPVSVVGGFTDWVQISAGSAHTAAIRANGTAWAWGLNQFGQLGDNSTSARSSPVSVVGGFTDWTQISGGTVHTVAIRANGTAWGWGNNLNGRLGDNSTTYRSSPVSVVGGFTDWVQISARNHTVGIRANGTAWAWGINLQGRLGDGTTSDRSSPVSVVGGFTDWVQICAAFQSTAALRAI